MDGWMEWAGGWQWGLPSSLMDSFVFVFVFVLGGVRYIYTQNHHYVSHAYVCYFHMYAYGGGFIYTYLIQQLNSQQTFDDVKTCCRIIFCNWQAPYVTWFLFRISAGSSCVRISESSIWFESNGRNPRRKGVMLGKALGLGWFEIWLPPSGRPLFLGRLALGPFLVHKVFKDIFHQQRWVFYVAESHAVDHGRDFWVTSLQSLIVYESNN